MQTSEMVMLMICSSCSTDTAGSFYGDWLERTWTCTLLLRTNRRG